MTDYRASVGQKQCTYSSLGNTYSGMIPNNQLQHAMYTVPNFDPNGTGPSYPPKRDTLAHGQQYLCGGYFTLKSAYPYATCTSCGVKYEQRPCDGKLY